MRFFEKKILYQAKHGGSEPNAFFLKSQSTYQEPAKVEIATLTGFKVGVDDVVASFCYETTK